MQLAVIRAKTDRDLATLLERALERSWRALTRGSLAEAESEYAGTAKLLALANGLPERIARGFRIQAAGLRAELDKRSSEACALLAS